jgi:hypothetical protein
LAVTDDGQIWHAIRSSAPFPWQPFNLLAPGGPGGEGSSFVRVGCSGAGWNLHVCAIDTNGAVWHAIRFGEQPGWQPFHHVAPGGVGGDQGPFSDLDCAVAGLDLHVAAVAADGGLWHAIRIENPPSWQPFNDVRQAGAGGVIGAVNGVGATVREVPL